VVGESLDSAAEWPEYWSVDGQVHRCDLGSSMDGWYSRRTRSTSNVQQHYRLTPHRPLSLSNKIDRTLGVQFM